MKQSRFNIEHDPLYIPLYDMAGLQEVAILAHLAMKMASG